MSDAPTCSHLDQIRRLVPEGPNRHATAHFVESRHPIVRSLEPGGDWSWCYEDELMFLVAGR